MSADEGAGPGADEGPRTAFASLRAIPGLIVLRPADANEVVEAWRVILNQHHEPVALILTLQDVPTLDPRQGHYALDPRAAASYPEADLNLERVGDYLNCDPGRLLAAAHFRRIVGPGELAGIDRRLHTGLEAVLEREIDPVEL